MARTLPKTRIAPGVLSWARASAGWGLGEAARKLDVEKEELRAWESGAAEVPLARLEDLGSIYRRPVAAFFLPRPPTTPTPPSDFRSLPGGSPGFSSPTWLAMRRARRLRDLAGLLRADVGERPEVEPGAATRRDDPEVVATRERQRLGVTLGTQRGWSDERAALRGWRTALERLSVLTFQFPMPVQEARGFSLADGGPPATVVSSDDAPHARIFSLLHEYGHIMLRTPGVCRPREETAAVSSIDVERWCDRFAGAMLMPREALAQDEYCRAFLDRRGSSLGHLARLSRIYKVSRHAFLTRLLAISAISRDRYEQEKASLYIGPRRRGGRGPLPAARCIAERGRAFTGLVIRALERDMLGHADVADYLGIRVKYLDQVRDLLGT